MDQNQFDNLTRCLASGLSRRQMLRVLLGAAGGIFASQVSGCIPSPPPTSITPTPTECTSECDKCIEIAQKVFLKEFEECGSQYTDHNAQEYQSCLEVMAQRTLASFDNCIIPSNTIEGQPLAYSGSSTHIKTEHTAASTLHKSNALISDRAAASSCNLNELSKCRDAIAYSADIALLACAGTDCLVGPPNCFRCVAKVLTVYFGALARCLSLYGCPGTSFCNANNICCGIGETGCGSACCTSEEKCVNGSCVPFCDPPLILHSGLFNKVCCSPCEQGYSDEVGMMYCSSNCKDTCGICDSATGQCTPSPGYKLCGASCCGSCQICDNGTCRNCNACEHCDANGECIAITGSQPCGEGSAAACCGPGQVCDDGICKTCEESGLRCYTTVNGVCVRREDNPVMCVDTIGNWPTYSRSTYCYPVGIQCCGTRGQTCQDQAICCPHPNGSAHCCNPGYSCCPRTINGVTQMTCCAPNQSCDCD